MDKYTQENRLLKITTPFEEEDYLIINSLKATEEISELFRLEVELLREEEQGWMIPEFVDAKKLLGQNVTIEISQKDGGGRFFNGMVNTFSQGSRGEKFTQYWITVVPNIWAYTQNKQSRIFQQKTVPSILKEVFSKMENMITWELDHEYKPRNYCVQYRESDFDFASRLMEEEGIYYYFEHTGDAHRMIVSDRPRFSRDCPGKSEITYTYIVTEGDFASAILRWETDYRLGTGQVFFRDHHIQQPGKNLAATTPTKFEVGGNKEWEIYDFPGGYSRKFDGINPDGNKQSDLDNIMPDGKRAAELAMAVIDAEYMTGDARSNCGSLTTGHRFKMINNLDDTLNGEYVVTSVSHEARQSPPYEGEEDEKAEAYMNTFRALAHGRPEAVPFRPVRKTAKPLVYGSQTAVVVGPGDEEIFTDEYGRIKVQFFWDRQGETNGYDSCWLPVVQPWAGANWGTMFIPRVGMEVLVHFMEGDPDQPIATGCVYHPLNMPPYKLPEEKTKSTIKTNSTKGGKGFNELRFEDEKGHEQVFIHGEKDLDVRIKNDRREWTGNDQHLIVKRDRREKIERDTHLIVERDQIEEIKRDRHVKVRGKEAIEIGGSHSLKISGDAGIEVNGSKSEEVTGALYAKGMNVVVEGMSQLTLKVGASFIDIGPAGISIVGTPMVNINSGGAPGAGVPNAIVPPLKPEIADIADDAKPGTKIDLEKQSAARKEKNAKKEDLTSWIKLALVDEAGNPVPGEKYKVKEADGTTHSGTLDDKGKAHVKLRNPGSCEVTFPKLDKDAWEDA